MTAGNLTPPGADPDHPDGTPADRRPAGSFTMRVTDAAENHIALTVRGDLDLATVPHFKEAVAAAHRMCDTVRLDLAGVEFIDLAGMHMLVSLATEARRLGKGLHLHNPSEHVRRLASLTRTAAELDIA
jgi:anti-anti-sigma factor